MTNHKNNAIVLYWFIDDVERKGRYTGKEIELVLSLCEKHLELMKDGKTDFEYVPHIDNPPMLSEYFEQNIDKLREMYENNTLHDYTSYMNLNLVKHYLHRYCTHYGYDPQKEARPDFASGEELAQNLYI